MEHHKMNCLCNPLDLNFVRNESQCDKPMEVAKVKCKRNAIAFGKKKQLNHSHQIQFKLATSDDGIYSVSISMWPALH